MEYQIALASHRIDNQILLTAVVNVADNNRNCIPARVLLDSASTTNFITNKYVEKLNLPKKKCSIPVGGLNGLTTYTKYRLKITIQSRDGKYQKSFDCLSIPSISEFIPTTAIPKDKIKIPTKIKLADPDFFKPAPIDILLGSGPTLSLFSIGQIKLSGPNEPELYLQKTSLGWVIGGDAGVCTQNQQTFHTHLQNMLTKFWEIEEGPREKYLSPEEISAEEHFKRHITRDSSGRYIVALPFNNKQGDLGSSKEIAMKRFLSLERKFKKDNGIQQAYSDVLQEYLDLKHMSKINGEITNGVYLPHHAVVKETSLTTKVRVVFDGSAKTSSGISLNETLLIGPTIQDDVFSLLLRFRFHKYVLTGDIEKMYRQFLVREEDRKYQLILWRDETGNIATYQLNTVTFGLSAAPFLAIRSLQQLAQDYAKQYPRASHVLLNDMYVDDLLTGSESLEEAHLIQKEIIECLKNGGLNIRQWASNDNKLLQNLPAESINQKLHLNDNKTLKTLGIFWNSETDSINYTSRPSANNKLITKRTILSDVASIFDPLGLLGPVILTAKHTIQQLWAAKVDWDESVPAHIHTQWLNFHQQLPLLNQITFKRNVLLEETTDIQLHGFADASNIGYGACIYIRCINSVGQLQTQLLCSRSRIAPLKTISTPRLELCAAQTLANLYTSVKEAIRRPISRVILWSDSMIALYWIKTSPHLLKTFVANRVAEIQQVSKSCEWRHVGSAENPADALSRGQLPQEFINNNLWQVGPRWLQDSEKEWPTELIFPSTTNEEFKTCLSTSITDNLLERFSCIHKAERIIAYCLRFYSALKKSKINKGPLAVKERNEAKIRIIRLAQNQSLTSELTINNSQKKKSKNIKQSLSQLNPFIDNDGLWRVGGRLQNSHMSFDQKHPIILPKHNHITNLIIKEVHISHFHAGIQTTLYALRQQYWPLDGKNQIRKIIHQCITCIRAKPPQINYIMGNLPESRVSNIESLAFQRVGVDYCGPILIKERKHQNRKKIKAYVSIFICMSSKAVHLELVSDLTSAGFLGALRRFIARRGKPVALYSDNGTNFVGANRELKEIIEELQTPQTQMKINNYLGDQGIEWHFSPPLSPHFGGLWEAAVKSFKYHLTRIAGNELFTFEEFNTLIVEIEGILNSRPLAPCSADPNDLRPLTPGDLIIGRSPTTLPERDLTSIPSNRLPNWALVQKIRQDLWRRWQHDYLNQLHVRSKWTKGEHQLKIGSLVLLRDDNLPSMQWKLGRVLEIHPGQDGIIRVVTLKTSNGILKRNVKKLALLPSDIDEIKTSKSSVEHKEFNGGEYVATANKEDQSRIIND